MTHFRSCHRLFSFLGLIITLFITACGPGVAEGPLSAIDSETSTSEPPVFSTDSESDSVQIYSPCPITTDQKCPEEFENSTPTTILLSTWFGEDTRFVTMAPNLILATEVMDGKEQPYTITFDFDESGEMDQIIQHALVSELPATSEPTEPIAVVTAYATLFGSAFKKIAIMFSAGTYLIYGVPEQGDTTTLVHLPQLDLVDGNNYSGAVYLANRTTLLAADHPELNALCLFGDGLICSDGTGWQRELSADGPRINAVGVAIQQGEPVVIAVGNGGSIRLKNGASWTTAPVLTDADLLTISSLPDGSRFTIAGTGGIHLNTSLSFEDPIICPMHGKDVLNVSYTMNDPFFSTLTTSGDLYSARLSTEESGHICQRNFKSNLPPIVGFPMVTSYFILTADTLYGRYWRPLVID